MKLAPKPNNPHGFKDSRKASVANKFIGRGSARSSTAYYAKQLTKTGYPVNCSNYTSEDVVFISVEGDRNGRLPFDDIEVGLALSAGATLVTDKLADRSRPHNVGERELTLFLLPFGYKEEAACHFSYWRPRNETNGKALD